MNPHYFILNGMIYSDEEQNLKTSNRMFLYGDGITQTIRAAQGTIFFINQHLDNLIKALQILEIEIPKRLDIQRQMFIDDISRLINKNKLFKGLLIKITVFRNNSQDILPQTDEASYIVETFADEIIEFQPAPTGMSITIYDKMPIVPCELSQFDTHYNKTTKILAAKYALANKNNDAVLLNANKNIVETAINGNIYIVKNDKLYLPGISEGCFNDLLRSQIITIAQELGLEVDQNIPLKINDLEQADEIFTASTVKGINWVAALERKRFFHKISDSITKKINELYK